MFKVKRSSGVNIINVQCTKIEDIPNELYESRDTSNLGIDIDGDFIDVFDSDDNLIRRNMYVNIYGAYKQKNIDRSRRIGEFFRNLRFFDAVAEKEPLLFETITQAFDSSDKED